jgi:hypothetical protein
MDAGLLKVKGLANFENLKFGYVDLRHAAFQTFKIIEPHWPGDPSEPGGRPVMLDGLTYDTILYAARKDELQNDKLLEKSHAELLKALESFKFNIENYVQLEKYARRTGYDDWADDIYIVGKQRELELELEREKMIVNPTDSIKSLIAYAPAHKKRLVILLLVFIVILFVLNKTLLQALEFIKRLFTFIWTSLDSPIKKLIVLPTGSIILGLVLVILVLNFSNLFTLIFWDVMAGYGRKPFRVLNFAVFFMVLGAFFFNPSILERKESEQWSKSMAWADDILCQRDESNEFTRKVSLDCIFGSFSNFWISVKYFFGVKLPLSVDIFVPTHHPVLVEHWDRYAIPYWMRFYYFFHRAMGMILVPIAAAAFFIHFHLGNP